jgi:hypothetical protein
MSNNTEIELTEAIVKDLCSIGLEVVLKNYFSRLKELAKEDGEPWDDERMDIVGQNGNDGLHYVTNDDGSKCAVAHKLKES